MKLEGFFPTPISCFEGCQTLVQNKSHLFLYLFAALYIMVITTHVPKLWKKGALRI
jgi:hypothetical protein